MNPSRSPFRFACFVSALVIVASAAPAAAQPQTPAKPAPETPAVVPSPTLPEPRPQVAPPTSVPVPTADAAIKPNEAASTPVATSTPRAGVAVNAADVARLGPTIRVTALSARDSLLSEISSWLASADAAVLSAQAAMSERGTETKKEFDAAADAVKEKARTLRGRVDAARKATEQDWNRAREQLATDYDAFAEALGRLDTATSAAGKTSRTPR